MPDNAIRRGFNGAYADVGDEDVKNAFVTCGFDVVRPYDVYPRSN